MILRIATPFVCSFLSIALVGHVLAEDAVLSFAEPEVLKLDWATRSLNVCDIDQDGLQDMAIINQDTAQIELLFQREKGAVLASAKQQLKRDRWEPVLEDARFETKGISIGFPVFDLSLGDFNGDGRVDLAYSGREVPLSIRYQSDSGKWTQLEKFDDFEALGWPSTVQASDMDGDGRAELFVLSADAVRIFQHEDNGVLKEPEVCYLTGENPYNLLLEDVNDDGLKDILYITANGKQSLTLREQLQAGGFGPERRFAFERPVRRVSVLPGNAGEPISFCSVDSRSGALEFFHLQQAGDAILHQVQPEIYPIFKKGRVSASYAMGDMNGDGAADLLIANPAAAELLLFLQEQNGFAAPQTFPSFSNISALSSGQFYSDAAESVVVVSAEERSIGISHQDTSGRLTFPSELTVGAGDPLVCEVVDLDRDGFDELALIFEQKGAYSLVLAQPVDRKDDASGWEMIAQQALSSAKRKPSGILPLDVFGKDRNGLMIMVAREAPLFLVATQEAPFELVEIAKESTIRQSMLKEVLASQLSEIDVDGDGSSELVVGRKGFARALKFSGDSIEMVDQFNARQGDDVVTAIIPILDHGELERMMLYVAASGELQFLKRGEDGVFRYEYTDKVGLIDLLSWGRLSDAERGGEILFAGESQFWVLPEQGKQWSREVDSIYETKLEDVHFSYVEGADFGADGKIDLIAVDGSSHVVEILTQDGDNWRSRMYWEIFEQNMHYQGRTGASLEPRQIVLSDLTGDGQTDFAFLIHDRILLYPSE